MDKDILEKAYQMLKDQAKNSDTRYIYLSHYVMEVSVEVYDWLLSLKEKHNLTWDEAFEILEKRMGR